MVESDDPTWREDVPWIELGVTLSLDVTQPFVAAMGLSLPPEPTRDAIRVALDEITAKAEDRANWPVDLAQHYRAQLEARVGAEAPDHFMAWSRHTFVPHHTILPAWSGWLMLMSLALQKERSGELPFPGEAAREIWSRFVEEAGIEELEDVFEGHRRGAFSDWDVLLMANHGLDPEYPPRDPLGTVASVVRMHRFQRVVHSCLGLISSNRWEGILSAGNAILEDLGVWMPGSLLAWPELPWPRTAPDGDAHAQDS